MSNALVREVRHILKYAAADCEHRASWEKRHLGVAAKQLNRVVGLLDEFLILPEVDPDSLDRRVTKMISAVGELELVLIVKDLNPPDPGQLTTKRFHDIEGDIGTSYTRLRTECIALIRLNHFFKKNSSRWEHGLEKEKGFTKQGYTYSLSKGLITDKLHEKMEKHVRKESGSQLVSNYKTWVYDNGPLYPDKSTAWLVTRYLLEKPDAAHWDKIYSPKKKLGFRRRKYEDLPDHQIRFIDGRAWATVTVVDLPQNSYLYLGLTDPSIAPKLWPLHTVQEVVDIDDRQVKFLPRTDQVAAELPWSLKYAMRHDTIFLEIKPHVAMSKHATAVTFKSIQAAGGIVVQNGKVVAIDNVSGHYEPGWGLLAQAVKLIKYEGAFHPNAMVGVFSGKAKATWFFPYEEFLSLASANFTGSGWPVLVDLALQWQFPNVNDKLTTHLSKGLKVQPSDEQISEFLSGIKRV